MHSYNCTLHIIWIGLFVFMTRLPINCRAHHLHSYSHQQIISSFEPTMHGFKTWEEAKVHVLNPELQNVEADMQTARSLFCPINEPSWKKQKERYFCLFCCPTPFPQLHFQLHLKNLCFHGHFCNVILSPQTSASQFPKWKFPNGHLHHNEARPDRDHWSKTLC